MDDFIIFVNAKAYEKATGTNAVQLARACEKYGAWLAVQAVDVFRVHQAVPSLRVFSQHIDPVSYGSNTGAVLPEAVLSAGASGTLLNHAEKQLSFNVLQKSVSYAKNAGLLVVVCADTLKQAKKIDSLGADYIALELPELIGGDVSIVSSDPSLIKEAVSSLQTPVLVGAGVQSGEDVRVAKQLGASGVLLASAVASKTDDPESVLASLVQGLT
ncbi:MAG: triose-phosphate isomerase [Candidatus Woesearchaeota archaeon]